MKPLMESAKAGREVLLFLDASHFVMGCDFLGGIYGKTRRLVRTYSGRKRYNVLGAIDFVSKKVITVTNDSYITATEIRELLCKISTEYHGRVINIILDNARYQKCEAVRTLADKLEINLVYIPPYSPNLNLIERLWKFVKGKLRTKYYSEFDVFKNTINSIIDGTDNIYHDKISTLIAEKVQLFNNLKHICGDTYSYESCPQKSVA